MFSILAAMCTPPVLNSPHPLSPSVYREPLAGEDGEDPLFGATTPKRTPAKTLILPSITPRGSSVWRYRGGTASSPFQQHRESQFDVLSFLPPELGLKVLHYLLPQDLCQVCLVCKKWNRLARDQPLELKRKKYVDSCREEYKQQKENYQLSFRTTPHHHRHMTSAASPLNIVQQKSVKKRETALPDLTPSPAYLSDTVSTLSLEDNTYNMRRCLFPDSTSELTAHLPSRTSAVEKCGKKSNRNRLRRL